MPVARLSDEEAYARVGRLINEMPDLTLESVTPETLTWVARVVALLEQIGDSVGAIDVRVSADSLGTIIRWNVARKIELTLKTALARLEMSLPISNQGAFIPAGNTFDAFAAVTRVVSQAKSDVFIVDPYADEKIFDFVASAPEQISIRLLSDAGTVKPSLKPGTERWIKQFAITRPLEARLASPRSLHDRLLIVDRTIAYTVGQSFKDLAERAHTSLVRADHDTAALKIQAYNAIWQTAAKL